MLVYLFPSESFLLLDLKTSYYKILCISRDLNIFMLWIHRETNFILWNIGSKFNNISTWPRSDTVNEFVKNKSNWPNITFTSVRSSLKHLRRHIQRSSYQWMHEFILNIIDFFGKSEICDFKNILVSQNICRLDISMNDWVVE